MDAANVRAEIKSWERAFKAENRRDPSIDDIKARPDIATKYKLYKRLSRKSSSSATSKAINGTAPSTPPRHAIALAGSSFLVPKSRATQTYADSTTINPFSPHKKTVGHNDSPLHGPQFMRLPSTPPSKKRAYSTPSPQNFPLIQPAQRETLVLESTPIVDSMVKKARKRLRGDLVSPSPKKRRTTCGRPNPGLRSSLPLSNSGTPEEDGGADASYIDESPIKVSSNGKNFILLFEEEQLPRLDLSSKNGPVSRSQSFFAPLEKRLKDRSSQLLLDNKEGTQLQRRNEALPTSKHPESPKASILRPSAPGRRLGNTVYPLDTKRGDAKESPIGTSRKRSSLEDAFVHTSNEHEQSRTVNAHELLPPSPPPSTAALPGTREIGKGVFRKKARLLADKDQENSADEEQSDVRIVEIDSRSLRRLNSRILVDDDYDDLEREVFGFTDGHDDPHVLGEDASDGDEVEVNLPEDLRRVLYISSSRARDREERALVESLLHGDPDFRFQRGEVWGVGEVEDATAAITDGEDDWAGEGVPWEVGEL